MSTINIKTLYITSDRNHSNWVQTRLLSVIPPPVPERQQSLVDAVINPQVSHILQLNATTAETIIQGPPKKCIHTLTKENSTLYNRLL